MLGGQVDVLDVSGKLLASRTITSVKEQLQLNHRGVVVLRMRSLSGETYFAKVVVQ